MYKDRIAHLQEAHRVLDLQISEMEKHPHVDEQRVVELKKKKLQLKDEIARLNKMQWEHDHETIHGDDDR